MKVTLQLSYGREMTFSEEELIDIVEKHLSSKDTKKKMAAKVAPKPTEGKWFEVKPRDIDQKLFEKKREGIWQEATRKLILKAFSEMKDNPKKYGKNFKTMMPKKTWKSKTVGELKKMACELGDHNADWVEQALEWAQRITNGESWESICNDKDTVEYDRMILTSCGNVQFVGGGLFFNSASTITGLCYNKNYILSSTVPLVVLYE